MPEQLYRQIQQNRNQNNNLEGKYSNDNRQNTYIEQGRPSWRQQNTQALTEAKSGVKEQEVNVGSVIRWDT